MPVIHFLNVREGDCSIIQHGSGRVSVIDVNNARSEKAKDARALQIQLEKMMKANFNQKSYPVNPIAYLREHGVAQVFRFILTHPDMDHMDGILDLFEEFSPANFWDMQNEKKVEFGPGCPFWAEDWEFYQSLHRNQSSGVTRLTLLSGATGQYYNRDVAGTPGGDGLHVLAPTQALIDEAIERDDYNDASYVLLYVAGDGNRIVFAGDSHDKTWQHILENHRADVTDIDLLIAPHHGRHSGRDFGFLGVLQPKLTLFGNAPSEHLAYGAWHRRGLRIITNNEAGCVVVDAGSARMPVYVTNKRFAKGENPQTLFSAQYQAWFLENIK